MWALKTTFKRKILVNNIKNVQYLFIVIFAIADIWQFNCAEEYNAIE